MPIAQLNGQGIYYEDTGGEGLPLVFLHGFLFDTTMFDAQVAALSSQYRCIRFDARALGQTQWDGQAFDLYDTVEDTRALLDHLGIEQAVIVGMSQGGYASLRFAVKYPERVKALIFLSTYNGIDNDDVKATYREMRDAWRANGPEGLVPTYLDLFVGLNEDLRATWGEKWLKIPADNIYHAMNNLTDRDEVTQEQVDTVTAPALVVHGGADVGMPSDLGKALYKSLPNAKNFVVVEGAPHAANVTHPDEVNAAIQEFLAEL
jgi:3-oxoadipate enol-lactonase